MTSVAAQPAGTAVAGGRLRAIVGGSLGNFVEWYDWFAYASFSLYFGKTFFPHGGELDRRLETAAVFAVGFFARPIGAWLMGVFADHRGRKAALVLSISLMCGGSLMIAVAPGYAQVGPLAPAILIAARLVQGLSLGGEYGASAVYVAEMAGRARRGFYSSFLFVTLMVGQLAALGVLIVLQALLTGPQISAFGWRIAFFIGAGLALVVWFIQAGLEETSLFRAEDETARSASTVRALLVRQPKEAAMVFVLSGAGALTFYSFTTYMPKFLTGTAHFSRPAATEISAASLVVLMVVQPLFGWLGDTIGRKRLLIFAFAAGALITWPILTSLAATRDPLVALALISAALTCLAAYTAVNGLVKSELFPTELRGLGVALPYAVANAIFGGTAELVAEGFKKVGVERGFFVYVSVIAAAACLVAARMRDTQKTSLIAD
ncbi:MAG TPA: MFS transporter [Caulobacteraceae bacterium]|jgi:MHS family alpha-ketoglutarate permease-like MFS transporter